MSKRQALMIIGIWVAIFLFLGLPTAWDDTFAVISGILIIIISIRLHPEQRSGSSRKSFVEHKIEPEIKQSPEPEKTDDIIKAESTINE